MAIALDPSLFCKKAGVVIALDLLPLLGKGRGGGHGPIHFPSSGKRENTITISKGMWPCSGNPLV